MGEVWCLAFFESQCILSVIAFRVRSKGREITLAERSGAGEADALLTARSETLLQKFNIRNSGPGLMPRVDVLVLLPHINDSAAGGLVVSQSVTVSQLHFTLAIRYDTIRDASLTCARKPTRVSLTYRMEPTAKKCKTEKKLKSKNGYAQK